MTTLQATPMRQQMAKWLSRIFHPFIISVITLVLAIYLDGASFAEAVKWTAIAVSIVILPLTLYLVYSVRNGRYSDWSISIREQRYSIYAIAIFCFIVLITLFLWTDAPAIALACLYASVPTIFIAALINRFLTKVSVHATTMAGCTTVITLLSPLVGIGMALMTLSVGWARIELKQHTTGQVLLGWFIAAVVSVAIFRLYSS